MDLKLSKVLLELLEMKRVAERRLEKYEDREDRWSEMWASRQRGVIETCEVCIILFKSLVME